MGQPDGGEQRCANRGWFGGRRWLPLALSWKDEYMNSIYNSMNSWHLMRSLEPSIRAMHYFDSIQRTTELMNSTRTIQTAFASIKAEDSVQRMMKSLDFTDSIQKAISSLNYTDSIQRMMRSVDQTGTLQAALASIKSEDSVQRMMKSLDFANSIQKAISSLTHTDSIHRIMESANYSKTINSITHSQDFSGQMQSVSAFLARPSILEQLIGANRSWEDLAHEPFRIDENEFAQSISPLGGAKSEKEFVSSFLKIPPVIQAIIIFFFLQVFVPQVNNVISQALNPYIQKVIATSNKTNKEIVKEVKKVPASSFGIDVSRFRFITGSNVRLRQDKSTDSPVIDELDIGQIVEVVSKKKNWIQVKVIYEEEVLTGWVFTRYTEKFKK